MRNWILSQKIKIHDSAEIAEAKWIDPVEFLHSDNVTMYNKSVVEAIINNKGVKLLEQKITLRVPNGEVFF